LQPQAFGQHRPTGFVRVDEEEARGCGHNQHNGRPTRKLNGAACWPTLPPALPL
jgi:hypothetical protein